MKKKRKKAKKRTSLNFLVKQDEEAFRKAISTEAGFLRVFSKLGEDPISFYRYQYGIIRNNTRFQWIGKSRQVGGSFAIAAKALARSLLRDGHDSIFVSYNLEDAKEKIVYARELYDDIPPRFKKKLRTDTQKEMSFETLSGKGRPSRIRSLPSKAPRGASGDIYLDEIAHYREDKKIYKGSTAIIIREGGQLVLFSSPLGRRGIFWEVGTQQLRKYPAYSRQYIPWWLCPDFCKDTKQASVLCPAMQTEERVERFGKLSLVQQFESLDVEDFQQEYELAFIDESTAYYPYELILANTVIDPVDLWDSPSDADGTFHKLRIGYDVGRKRHMSVLCVVEEDKKQIKKVRMLKLLKMAPFSTQEEELCKVMDSLPAILHIDQTGIGMQLAEKMVERYPGRVIRETFTHANKKKWCGDFRIGLERRMIRLPKRRDVVSHIHAIRKTYTHAGNVVFDVDGSDKSAGHADIFWALALACQMQRNVNYREEDQFGVTIIG